MISRRNLLKSTAAGAAILAMPRIGMAQGQSVLRIVPHTDLAVVDPMWTTALITRTHGYAVFDTLYGTNANFEAQPQMVESHTLSGDHLIWTLTLRDNLLFHDGTPVTAADAVASVLRWWRRDDLGRELMAATDEIVALDDKTLEFRLVRPFPMLPETLGRPSGSMPAIMPARIAEAHADTQVSEVIGSGPYRFLADEWIPGSRIVYERFDGYVSRTDEASFTAGAKHPLVNRVEMVIIPDAATAGSALITGEVDVWEKASADFLPILAGQPDITFEAVTIPDFYILRLNHLHPPFNNPAIRRALLPALDQLAFMNAIAGQDSRGWAPHAGFFNPGSPMANDAGSEVLSKPRSLDTARQMLAEAGYDGTPVVLLDQQDVPGTHAGALVAADLLRQIGFTVDLQPMDWGTLVQRRSNMGEAAEGGWSMFVTALSGTGAFDPASNFALRGNGEGAWFGWPSMPRIEELRQEWLNAPDLDAQKDICREVQLQAFEDVPYVPLGGVVSFNAVSNRVHNLSREFLRFYNVELN